jgi:apolipoprotein N-acyltransferase
LLPIGEFIPFEDWIRGLAPIFDLPMSSFSRGEYQQANLEAKGYHFAPAICFEIAFPRQIAANLYYNTDFIITVSNDAWFGGSHGPAQHLEIAQARAKEFGLPVLRATNNGITAFIDHQGQIQSRLPQFEAAVLSDIIQQVKGYTPYRLFGDWPIWCLSFVIFAFASWNQKKAQEN